MKIKVDWLAQLLRLSAKTVVYRYFCLDNSFSSLKTSSTENDMSIHVLLPEIMAPISISVGLVSVWALALDRWTIWRDFVSISGRFSLENYLTIELVILSLKRRREVLQGFPTWPQMLIHQVTQISFKITIIKMLRNCGWFWSKNYSSDWKCRIIIV